MAKVQKPDLKAVAPYDISFAQIHHSEGNWAETVQKLATAINVQFTEAAVHLPFIRPKQFQYLLKEQKVFIVGPSGCGKSRTIIELLRNKDVRYDRIFVMNPSNPAGLNSARENMIALSQQLGPNDLVIWDNFPDGLIKRDLENAFAALEIINSARVQNLYIALRPSYLEMYRGLTLGIPEIFTYEITSDLAIMKQLVREYGQVEQYKRVFSKYVSSNADEIAKVLWQKQPLPLTVVDYYKALLDKSSSQLNIDELAALKIAQSWLPVYDYFERQFEIMKNIPGRKRDVEFLYVLRLCYEVGFDRTHASISKLQEGIFGSEPPTEPIRELGTWLYLSGQNYAMHDSAKNAVKLVDYIRMKITSYIANNFSTIVPKGDGELHSFGLFIGKNIQFIPDNNIERPPPSSSSLLPKQIYGFMKKKPIFERAIGRGIGENFEVLDDVLQELILEFVDTEIEFGNGLADSLGERFIELDKGNRDRVLEKIYHGMLFARYFGQSIGRLFDKMPQELRSQIMTHAEKNPQFADGLGMGLGYIFATVNSFLQAEIMSKARRGFEISRGLGFGFGLTFALQQEDDALKIVSTADSNSELDTGFGMGMAVSYPMLADKLRKFVFERVATNCEFAFGVGVYSAYSYRESCPTEIFELLHNNTEVSYGLGVGYGAGFFYLSEKFQSELDALLKVNMKLDDGFGSGIGLILKHLPANVQDMFFAKASANNAFAMGLGYGLGFTWQYIGDTLRKRAVTVANSNRDFARGLGCGLGCHFEYLKPTSYFDYIINLASRNSQFDMGLGMGAAWGWPYYNDDIRASINERIETNPEFARGIAFGLARVIRHFSADERERLLARLEHDRFFAEGFGEGIGNYLWSIYNKENRQKFLEQAKSSPEMASGFGIGIGNNIYFYSSVESGANSYKHLFSIADPCVRRGLGIGIGRAYKYLPEEFKVEVFQIAQNDLEFALGLGQGIGTIYGYLEPSQKELIFSYLGDNGFSRGLGIGLGSIFSYTKEEEEIKENVLKYADGNAQLSLGLGEGLAIHLSYTSMADASKMLELLKSNSFIASGFGQGYATVFQYLPKATEDSWLSSYLSMNEFAFGFGIGIGKTQKYPIKQSIIFEEEEEEEENEVEFHLANKNDKFMEGLAIGLGSIAKQLPMEGLIKILSKSKDGFAIDFGFGLGHNFSLLDSAKRRELIEIAADDKKAFLIGLAEGAGHCIPSAGIQALQEIIQRQQALSSSEVAAGAARGITESFKFLSLPQVLSILEYVRSSPEFAKILGRGLAKKFASIDQETQSLILDAVENGNNFSSEFMRAIPSYLAYVSSESRERINELIVKYQDAKIIPETNEMVEREEYIRFAQFPVVGLSTKARAEWNIEGREITFSGKVQNCCVCFIDMIGSTKISSELSAAQFSKYYEIFLNAIALIARNFGAKIVKNAGDALIFFFDNVNDPSNITNFKNVLDCCLTMGIANSMLNAKMLNEQLPPIKYRISADYGQVSVANSASSQSEDLFGPAMNICAKINSMAKPSGLVIGKNLFDIVQGLDEYLFSQSTEVLIGNRGEKYTVYHVRGKEEKGMMNPFERKVPS